MEPIFNSSTVRFDLLPNRAGMKVSFVLTLDEVAALYARPFADITIHPDELLQAWTNLETEAHPRQEGI